MNRKILIELDDLYADALMQQAMDNGISRNELIVDGLIKAVDAIPGLLDRVRASRSGEHQVDFVPRIESGRKTMFADPVIRLKRYRFRYLDGSPAIEGVGEAAGDAVAEATGRKWTADEYGEVFMTPEFMGYED